MCPSSDPDSGFRFRSLALCPAPSGSHWLLCARRFHRCCHSCCWLWPRARFLVCHSISFNSCVDMRVAGQPSFSWCDGVFDRECCHGGCPSARHVFFFPPPSCPCLQFMFSTKCTSFRHQSDHLDIRWIISASVSNGGCPSDVLVHIPSVLLMHCVGLSVKMQSCWSQLQTMHMFPSSQWRP